MSLLNHVILKRNEQGYDYMFLSEKRFLIFLQNNCSSFEHSETTKLVNIEPGPLSDISIYGLSKIQTELEHR